MNEILKNSLKCNLRKLHFLRIFFRLLLVTFVIGYITSHATINAQATQGITITGSVTDAVSGEPLLGVNIVLQGTYVGSVTDLTGKFTINVPNEQSVLVFSSVGYQSISIPVGSQRMISVILKPDVAALEEVVVVGYGVQKKESVVGAVSQATGETIRQNLQGGDLRSGLTGAIPGLITLRTTGRPGGADFGSAPSGYES